MRTRFFGAAALGLLAFGHGPLGAGAPAPLPSDTPAIVHALSRLTFGARPGDVERVKAQGLQAWIEQQLAPARTDDGAMAARLARLDTLALDSDTLARDYHIPARMERQQRIREQEPRAQDEEPAGPRRRGAPGQGPDGQRRQLSEAARKDQQIVADLSSAKLLRAVYSERQLEEVLVDFWFNHFNVFAGKGPERVWVAEYERDAIRPYVLGSFREMLGKVAESEAMLFYLDNWMSAAARDGAGVGSGAAGGGRPGRDSGRGAGRGFAGGAGRNSTGGAGRNFAGSVGRNFAGSVGRNFSSADRTAQARNAAPGGQGPFARRPTGLNENYARELLELHTLGVDGGYTQDDVVNVARAFTGWTISAPGQPGGFRFDASRHDAGEKRVLGRTIKAGGGVSDGLQVLDILAAHPSTARFIATKLAARFVSDEPPRALVDRATAQFTATKGDLRAVTRAIITSPEFFAPGARGAKVKTPFEFVASALRATGADVQNALPLTRALREMGQPPYLCNPPTGYDDTAAAWVSSGALVTRMNFAADLVGNRLRGVRVPLPANATSALTIGAPEFQRR